MDKQVKQLFKRGSRTYFISSLFFPKAIYEQVSTLYAFVRKADNFVDAVPQDVEGFRNFRIAYQKAWQGIPSGDVVIDGFVVLARTKNFQPAWIEAFLDAMAADITTKTYETLADVEAYMYGSAEVVGLMMARILDLPAASYAYAQRLGKAMQYINFIRDVAEDLSLGRTYLPQAELRACGLESLAAQHVLQHPVQFRAFMHMQIGRYQAWQVESQRGFAYIPRQLCIPIKTAADMYGWTARCIAAKPLQIFRRKIKPSVLRVLGTGLLNMLRRDRGYGEVRLINAGAFF